MVYSTSAEVQNYLPTGYLIGTKPAPSAAQVTQFLLDCSNEIDAAIASRGLAVPVATPSWFLAECVRLNAMGAAAQCLLQIFPLQPGQSPGGYNSGSMSAGAVLYRRYDQRLTEIRKGVGVPVGASVQENDLAPRAYLVDTGAIGNSGVIDAFGAPVNANPVFSMDQQF